MREVDVMSKIGKILWVVAIIFMGLTATMNLLGGTGTVCAAFLTDNYPSMSALMDYRWLYQALMILTVSIGILNIWVLISLIKKRENSYRNAVILLIIGTVIAAIQVYASLALRGKAVPANMKLYTNAITLILFLILRAPGIREWVDFSTPASQSEKKTAAGAAAIVAGLVTLSVFGWVGASHTYMGENWVEVLQTPLIIAGTLLTIGGLALMSYAAQSNFQRRISAAVTKVR
jgi:hypothetical protein